LVHSGNRGRRFLGNVHGTKAVVWQWHQSKPQPQPYRKQQRWWATSGSQEDLLAKHNFSYYVPRHEARRMAHDARHMTHDARRTMHDARHTMHDTRHTTHDTRRGAGRYKAPHIYWQTGQGGPLTRQPRGNKGQVLRIRGCRMGNRRGKYSCICWSLYLGGPLVRRPRP